MHLLAARPGQVDTGEAVDLGQTPGDIVILSAADTDLTCFAAAQAQRLHEDADAPSLRLANIMHLSHNYAVDLYVETVISKAKLVLVRLLGGVAYWPYGVERLVACARRHVMLALVPGDDQPDIDLTRQSTLPPPVVHRLWQYGVHGGVDNAVHCLRYVAELIGGQPSGTPPPGKHLSWHEPRPLLRAGFYSGGGTGAKKGKTCDLAAVTKTWRDGRPLAALVFYRALAQAADTAPVDALITGLKRAGLNVLPLYVASLKDPVAASLVGETLAAHPPDIILNAVAFAVNPPGHNGQTPYDDSDCPVLQVVFTGRDKKSWRADCQGLTARDIAMHVALPEIDGRVLTRAVAFKESAYRDAATQCDIARYQPVAHRVDFVAALAAATARLRRLPAGARRLALVLANYPNRDGRLGNGVGLDAPAAAVGILHALAGAGYDVRDIPADGAALIARLKAGPTNNYHALARRLVSCRLDVSFYREHFARLPAPVRKAVTRRWGQPEADPFFLASDNSLAIPAFSLGHVTIGLQPARGYNIDPEASYHDPALVPPHSYLAFYIWLRHTVGVHAVVHLGKHGNLEWLPGKALALDRTCFPEAVLGPVPHFYPFIVNDPGEGSQAKRRTAAAIIDHLTPPLTRAGTHGPQAELEALVDEYFEATTADPRRLPPLQRQIRDLLMRSGLDVDCGIARREGMDQALTKLDSYLCELKEMQIRDGLHVFGVSPEGDLLHDLLCALARSPRGDGHGGNQSLTRALARDLDLDLDFDPLDCDMGAPWRGPRPADLAGISSQSWRVTGDTVARLEDLALALIKGERDAPSSWSHTRDVLTWVATHLRPTVIACGPAEMAGLLAGLDGRFIAPGPSGAPTRGRPDVLPTGRNFYSLDIRSVPTPAAWELGWMSATRLLERHAQDHGDWPRRLAMTAWGTSNMRTGGDDIAQALALIGARPRWDEASRRVVGFEIIPASVLGRPRVDVILRISGFFRDAFPGLIDLFDGASTSIAALDEPPEVNPLAAGARAHTARLTAQGVESAQAWRAGCARVFGSPPGAYGAGLQALIDERGWHESGDLARAYLAWGGYAYGGGRGGAASHDVFAHHLRDVDVVVQNQDNREHDLLDSDDYYQFEGGLSVTVSHLSGREPQQYHMDHSRPFSPRVHTLSEEIARVVRARATNPKWIKGVMRHGYKGAFEMAATVDYLFAFAATTSCVRHHHFEAVHNAYIVDERVRDFLKQANPDALAEMSARLREAIDRGLWRPRANSAYAMLRNLEASHGKSSALGATTSVRRPSPHKAPTS